jgi:hypothetical protein
VNIKFEVGKKYITRTGAVVYCNNIDYIGQTIEFIREDNRNTFISWFDGRQYSSGLMDHIDDVIAEYNFKSFDWTKPAQTKNGKKVSGLTLINWPAKYNLVGYIEGNQSPSCWDKEGCNSSYLKDFQLENIPEKKFVPLEPKDIKPGYLIKRKEEKDEDTWEIIVAVHKSKSSRGDYCIRTGLGKSLNLKHDLSKSFLISRDNGITWEQCNKTV